MPGQRWSRSNRPGGYSRFRWTQTARGRTGAFDSLGFGWAVAAERPHFVTCSMGDARPSRHYLTREAAPPAMGASELDEEHGVSAQQIGKRV